ncbi:MAG: glycosyltransferase [Erysipelotrichia bacterium]|nr:glycosyltransferase [Erysipelotrichia bacterium]
MDDKYSVIVAHPYRQHSYQTAVALQSKGTLKKYITMIYKKNHSFLGRATAFLPEKFSSKISNYNYVELDETKVVQVCQGFALFVQLLSIVPGLRSLSNIASSVLLRMFNRKLARLVMKLKPEILITYDTLSGDVLAILAKKNFPIIKIVDMSAPYIGEMKRVFESNLSIYPEQLKEVRDKFNSRDYRERLNRSRKELEYADFFLCASEYTKKSLVLNGINEKKIHVCRYGTTLRNNDEIINRKNLSPLKRKLTGLYIGNISYTKGVQYIVYALKQCLECIESFTYIGAIQNASIIAEANKKIELFTGYISHVEVIDSCGKADFSVFPSLADGFGFAVVESMAAGLPVICSENVGMSDLILDGINGFIVEAGNSYQISEKIKWFYENPEKLLEMGAYAKKTIQRLTFDNYYADLNRAVLMARSNHSFT